MGRFDHFNLISPIYDHIFGRRIDHEIVQFADLHENQSLLDIGGGTGRVTVLFSEITQKLLVADSATKMLQIAKQKGIFGVNCESEKLPFGRESIERVILVDALHHVANQAQTLKEMWRVLSPGGKMIIEEPDIQNFYVKLIAIGEKVLFMRSHFLSPKEIIALCQFDNHAAVKVHREHGIAWIIITKPS
jgi:demethylmenaquinone methyltransferase/2-methoxy-6-polyprenyl-1,4-benzoquinol methylase